MATKKKNTDQPVMLTINEAAAVYSAARGAVKPRAVALWCRQGLIPGVVLDKGGMHARWLIPQDSLLAFERPKEGWRKGRPRKGAAIDGAVAVVPNTHRKEITIDGVTYDSMKLAALALGISPSGLSKRLSRAKVSE